jgi:hypothetical protein
VAADVVISHWLVFMIVLLALFLGFIKRRQEWRPVKQGGAGHRPVLSKYEPYFLDQMTAILTSSIVVVYMLYTVDNRTVAQFGSDHLIYSIPFVYYGIFRYLFLVHRRRLGEDPAVLLFADRNLLCTVALWLATCVAVIYFGL